jgi:N-acetylneuraminic acid mutarotase
MITLSGRRRKSLILILIMVFFGLSHSLISVDREDLSVEWSTSAPIPVAKDDFGVATIDGKIYIAGGMTGAEGTPLDSMAVYHPHENDWEQLERLPIPLRSVRSVSIDKDLLVVGGSTEKEILSTVWSFDTNTRTWSEKAEVPLPIQGFGLISVESRVFAIGGYGGENGEYLDTVFEYDPVSDHWAPRQSMDIARTQHSVVELDGLIYVLGGLNDSGTLDSVEVYNPEADQWHSAVSLESPLESFGAVSESGKIHVLHHTIHYTYSPESGKMADLTPMPSSRHGFGVTVLDGVLYALGGCHENLYDLAVNETFPISRHH